MLGFDPVAPSYPSHVNDNAYLFRPYPMQADHVAYSPYSPPPTALGKFPLNPPLTPPTPSFPANPTLQSFTFDPFADEDSSTSSIASERERELEVHRLRRVEFLRHREWMRRVVAWVDGVSHGTIPPVSPFSASKSAHHHPGPYNYTQQRDPVDSPTLFYSSTPSLAGRSDEDDEPYLIYSTPLPGSTSPTSVSSSPSPSPVPKPVTPTPVYTPAVPPPHISPPPQAPSSRRIHGRMRSLSSIREEDEVGA